MANTVHFTYGEKQYTLEFTRTTIAMMEKQGFHFDGLHTKPVNTLTTLFSGAFLAHHRYTKPALIEEIFSKLDNKEELFAKLLEMAMETVDTLTDDSEDEKGNVAWESGK